MSILGLSPPLGPVIKAGCGLLLLGLAACAGAERLPATPDGPLFSRGLDQIGQLYIEPVTSRRLALSGARRLALLDNRLGISGNLTGGGFGDTLALSYDNRDIAFFAPPPDNDSRQWGGLIANIIATAKQASPRLAALTPEVIETAVFSGMTGALDRFSHYVPPEQARDQRAQRDGFGGIGVTLDTTGDTFRVTATTPQSPAERAGIRPEDQIVAIDGVATTGAKEVEVVHRLRGPIGSAVALRVLRRGTPRDLQLRRAYVVLPTVTMTRDGDIVIFRITSFNHSTTARIAKGLVDAEREVGGKLAGIVLDLRGNPGGLLDQAVSLADLFIHDGPIVSAIGRHPASKQYFAAAGDAVAPNLPIAVLINGGSASASEIVAATLQDRGRAVVIGSSSYGKGTVQTVLRLPNDGDLIVTWARLVAPSGYLLQTHGVVPTMCTAALGDDAQSTAAVASGGAGETPTLPPRAALDERGWAALRQACPGHHSSPPIDLKLARRILADPRLYAEALHWLAPATHLAENIGTPAGPALTGGGGTLSSPSR